jgi:phosphatidylserine/phosphatidylglycerophosphate/cardiolipin synthase-like enzyme
MVTMVDPDRWQQEFPNAIPSDVTAHIDGESYFGAVAKALDTAKGKDHFIFITGWMMDVLPNKSVNKVYSAVLTSLENAAKRRVKIILLIWNNPTYIEKRNELRKWSSRFSWMFDVTVIDWEIPHGPQAPTHLLRRFTTIMDAIKRNATPTWIYTPDLFSSLMYAWTSNGSPSAQQISEWLKQVGFHIGAHHEKNVFVLGQEGLIGFCGGIDFNVNRLKPPQSPGHYYHDVAVEIKGPASVGIFDKCMTRVEDTIWAASHYKELEDLKSKVAKAASSAASSTARTKVQIVGTYNSQSRGIKVRSGQDAFLTILRGARRYIYIEDQYLVNLDVAAAINKRVDDEEFELAMFVVQDSDETGDILVPNRKRRDFLRTVKGNIRDKRKLDKIRLVVINKEKNFLDKHGYHSGLHSKLLIVDDEIAIIGSTNVNQRSFTLDSETSAVVYGGDFASMFRQTLWCHMVQPETTIVADNQEAFTDWNIFPEVVRNPHGPLRYPLSLLQSSYLKNYNLDGSYQVNKVGPNKLDVDEKVAKWIEDHPNRALLAGVKDLKDLVRDIWTMGGRRQVSFADIVDDPRQHVPALIDVIWEQIIDPKV